MADVNSQNPDLHVPEPDRPPSAVWDEVATIAQRRTEGVRLRLVAGIYNPDERKYVTFVIPAKVTLRATPEVGERVEAVLQQLVTAISLRGTAAVLTALQTLDLPEVGGDQDARLVNEENER